MPSNKKNSVMVRIPKDLKARLDRMTQELNASYEQGRTKRELSLTEQGTKGAWVPIHELIRVALDEYESKKQRSNRPRKKTQKNTASTCRV